MLREVSSDVLHPDYLLNSFGEDVLRNFSSQVTTYAGSESGTNLPHLVLAIQSYDHSPAHIGSLSHDIGKQYYPADKVHPILLSAKNSDETLAMAKKHEIEIRKVPVRESLRADYLNTAVQEAKSLQVAAFVSTVGHAALSNRYFLQVAAGHIANERVDTAAYGVALPKEGTMAERWGARLLGATAQLRQSVRQVTEPGMGIMASDCAIWPVRVVEELKGFNEAYGLGGADGEMAKRMLHDGVEIYQDSLLSAHVTKDFGPIDSVRQLFLWRSLKKPHDFDPEKFGGWHPHGGL
jgi:hypothetical protein